MRKFSLLLTVLIISIILVACNNDNENASKENNSTNDTENNFVENDGLDDITNNEDNEVEIDDNFEEEIEEEYTVPDPIEYSGSGDDVIKIEAPEEGPITLFVKGNDSAAHFAVKGFDDNDNSTELFVNTTDVYEGITFDPTGETTLLEISAKGDWSIESRSLNSMRILDSGNDIEGSGDEVILVTGNTSLIEVEGNKGENHFAIRGYNPNPYLIVNTTDNYSGTNRLESETFVLEVTSSDDWTLMVE